jgi:hypothetical protein
MNDLLNFFKQNHNGRQIHKFMHYFDIYDRYFSNYRNRPIVFLEIGIQNGGSYKMWRDYFGQKAIFYGIDIDPRCKNFEEEGFKVFIGSQKDTVFLNSIISQMPEIDIILDDGGHTMEQQIVSFEALFPHLKNGGIYMVEDTHTSYYHTHGGGYKRMGTFIEYAKRFADVVHGFHITQENDFIKRYKEKIRSIHFYDSIVVLEKDEIKKPYTEITGVITIPYIDTFTKYTIVDKLINILNLVLRRLRLPSINIKDDASR